MNATLRENSCGSHKNANRTKIADIWSICVPPIASRSFTRPNEFSYSQIVIAQKVLKRTLKLIII